MDTIRAALPSPDPARTEIPVPIGRQDLAGTVWRARAEDGREFQAELATPLRPGDAILQTEAARYVVRQREEPVLEVALDLAPSAAAGIGWAFGNAHLELCAEPSRLLAADVPAARQLLDRLRIPYRPGAAVFRPGRFSRGARPAQDLGPGHRHDA